MKRILTIQDISCLGKCSITVALPIISAMGVETVILPTALLSTHTMFKDFTVKDLEDQLLPITRHWKKEGVHFDAIYTGYLGTQEEIELVKQIITELREEDTLIFVDPVMGDKGRLYTRFDTDYALKNASLCQMADFIVPNITEACFMTGIPYKESYEKDYCQELLQRLSSLCPGTVALTGVSLSPGKTGVFGINKRTGERYLYQNNLVPASYHGTGDLFASCSVAGYLRGLSWQQALKLSSDYVARTIWATLGDEKKPWYGVNFEETIPWLVQELQKALEP